MSEQLITKKDVDYVAKLARVAISPEETALYQEQLERILGYIGQLKEIDTKNVKPTAHPHAVSNVWRDKDEPRAFEAKKELMENAPDLEETFYRVKKVIE